MVSQVVLSWVAIVYAWLNCGKLILPHIATNYELPLKIHGIPIWWTSPHSRPLTRLPPKAALAKRALQRLGDAETYGAGRLTYQKKRVILLGYMFVAKYSSMVRIWAIYMDCIYRLHQPIKVKDSYRIIEVWPNGLKRAPRDFKKKCVGKLW